MTSPERVCACRNLIPLLDILASLTALSLLSPLLLILTSIRALVTIAAKIKYGYQTKMVDPSGPLLLLANKPASNNNIDFIVEINGPVELQPLRDRLQKHLTNLQGSNGRWRHSKLKSYIDLLLGFGIYRFEEAFDISQHVLPVSSNLTSSGGVKVFTSKEDVCNAIQGLRKDGFLMSKTSPWRVHLLHYKNASTAFKSVLVVEIDQALCDFYSTANVFMDALLDRKPSEKSERIICTTSGYPLSCFNALTERLKGICGMLRPSKNRIMTASPANPLELQRISSLATAKLLGGSSKDCRNAFLPPPIFMSEDILNDIRNVTTVGEFPIVICAFLKALVRFWFKYKLNKTSVCLETCKNWTYSLGIPVPFWDPAEAKLKLANNVSVIKVTFRAFEFMNQDDTRALRYVREQVDSSMADSTWAGWAVRRLLMRNLPQTGLALMSKLSEGFPVLTISMSSCTFTSLSEHKMFGHDLGLAAFHPPILQTQDLGAIVQFHDGLVSFQLFGTSLIFDSEEEVIKILKMTKAEILEIHGHLVPSTSAEEVANLERNLVPKDVFFLGYSDASSK